jgi:hypothetical protein
VVRGQCVVVFGADGVLVDVLAANTREVVEQRLAPPTTGLSTCARETRPPLERLVPEGDVVSLMHVNPGSGIALNAITAEELARCVAVAQDDDLPAPGRRAKANPGYASTNVAGNEGAQGGR